MKLCNQIVHIWKRGGDRVKSVTRMNEFDVICVSMRVFCIAIERNECEQK